MTDRADGRGDDGVNVRHEGGNVRQWVLGITIALVVIIALQNSQKVKLQVLFIDTTAPLILVLLIAVALGAVIGYAAPVLLRHRREQRRKDRAADGR